MLRSFVIAPAAIILATSGFAWAQDQTAPPTTPPDQGAAPATPPTDQTAAAPPPEAAPAAEAPAEAPKPAPYSIPWQLRPVTPGNSVRLDTTYAMYENGPPAGVPGAQPGSTAVQFLSASYKIIPNFAIWARQGWANNTPPGTAFGAFAWSDLAAGGTFGVKFADDFRFNATLGLFAPWGSGGGDPPSKTANNGVDFRTWTAQKATDAAAQRARSAMDNAMFAPNDFTIMPGVGLAYLKEGFTVQIEATLFELLNVRAGNTGQVESTKTNFTSGLHAGYYFLPEFSFGAELRYQRWLNAPQTVDTDNKAPPAGTNGATGATDNWTFAFGPRFHFKAGGMGIHPGISYSRGLDRPLAGSYAAGAGGLAGGFNYQMLQLDLPVTFK